MIKLGDKVKDTVTGYTGIAICKAVWLHGCVRFTVQSDQRKADGMPVDSLGVDEAQLVIVKKGAVKDSATSAGPRPDPKR